jgi:hypothetical protein
MLETSGACYPPADFLNASPNRDILVRIAHSNGRCMASAHIMGLSSSSAAPRRYVRDNWFAKPILEQLHAHGLAVH